MAAESGWKLIYWQMEQTMEITSQIQARVKPTLRIKGQGAFSEVNSIKWNQVISGISVFKAKTTQDI